MIYCDTSVLVSALSNEPRSEEVRAWLEAVAAGELCISDWTVTEFASAISAKVRFGSLPKERKPVILTQWHAMLAHELTREAVASDAFDLAARFCDMPTPGLRAGDALHLAVASLGGHSLATLDERMMAGAEAAGVRVVLVAG